MPDSEVDKARYRIQRRGRVFALALGVAGGLGVSGGVGVLRLGDHVGWRVVTATATTVAVVAAASWAREFRRRHWRPWAPRSPRVLLVLALLAVPFILAGPGDWVDLAAIVAVGLVVAAVYLHLRRRYDRGMDMIPTDLRKWTTPVGAAVLIGGGLALIGGGVVTVGDGAEVQGYSVVVGGVSLLADGVATLWKYMMVLWPTLIGGSLALIGFGVVQIVDGAVLIGVAVIGCGVAMASLVSAAFMFKDATDSNHQGLACAHLALFGCVLAFAGLVVVVLVI